MLLDEENNLKMFKFNKFDKATIESILKNYNNRDDQNRKLIGDYSYDILSNNYYKTKF